jgi:hypothetical protein
MAARFADDFEPTKAVRALAARLVDRSSGLTTVASA